MYFAPITFLVRWRMTIWNTIARSLFHFLLCIPSNSSAKTSINWQPTYPPGVSYRFVGNVTNFGAFIDVGVHQDGLVHISAMSDTFIKDPREVVKAGDIVKVKVMEVDAARKRIALSMRMSDDANEQAQQKVSGERPNRSRNQTTKTSFGSGNSNGSQTQGSMADALAAAFKKGKK